MSEKKIYEFLKESMTKKEVLDLLASVTSKILDDVSVIKETEKKAKVMLLKFDAIYGAIYFLAKDSGLSDDETKSLIRAFGQYALDVNEEQSLRFIDHDKKWRH